MAEVIDISGNKYGKLTAIRRLGTNHKRKSIWLCKCECGNETEVLYDHLKYNNTKSCGCSRYNRKHNKHNTRLYRIWQNMKNRCSSPNCPAFHRYGGRGIKVCNSWEKDFLCFYKWALNNGYTDKLTLDRVDNDGDYEPDNCRWVSKRTQANNKVTNVFLTINGESKTIAEWSRKTGVHEKTIWNRYKVGDSGLDLIRPAWSNKIGG